MRTPKTYSGTRSPHPLGQKLKKLSAQFGQFIGQMMTGLVHHEDLRVVELFLQDCQVVAPVHRHVGLALHDQWAA